MAMVNAALDAEEPLFLTRTVYIVPDEIPEDLGILQESESELLDGGGD